MSFGREEGWRDGGSRHVTRCASRRRDPPNRPLSPTAHAPRRRYGLIGPNGCGKSCLLKALGARDVPIPDHIDVYLLDKEIAASDMTALQASPATASAGCPRLPSWTGCVWLCLARLPVQSCI